MFSTISNKNYLTLRIDSTIYSFSYSCAEKFYCDYSWVVNAPWQLNSSFQSEHMKIFSRIFSLK